MSSISLHTVCSVAYIQFCCCTRLFYMLSSAKSKTFNHPLSIPVCVIEQLRLSSSILAASLLLIYLTLSIAFFLISSLSSFPSFGAYLKCNVYGAKYVLAEAVSEYLIISFSLVYTSLNYSAVLLIGIGLLSVATCSLPSSQFVLKIFLLRFISLIIRIFCSFFSSLRYCAGASINDNNSLIILVIYLCSPCISSSCTSSHGESFLFSILHAISAASFDIN